MDQPSPPYRVLIVEDDEGLRYAWRRWLEAEGYEVTGVATAAEARAALHTPPDVLLMDQKLPDGTGTELIEEAMGKGLLEATSTALVTAFNAPELIKGLHEGVLQKPVNSADLLRVVERRAREARQVRMLAERRRDLLKPR